MAVADRVAEALAADDRFGALGGDQGWPIFTSLMPDKPAELVTVADKPNTDEGAAKETGAVRIVARSPRYDRAVAKVEAAADILAGQPLADWLAMGENGVEDTGADDSRRSLVATEVTFRELCDTVTIRRYRRQMTRLAYRYVDAGVSTGVRALVAVETGGDRELYRGAMIQRADVTVYVKAGDLADVGERLRVDTDRGRVDVHAINRLGTGCARNVVALTGPRQTVV